MWNERVLKKFFVDEYIYYVLRRYLSSLQVKLNDFNNPTGSQEMTSIQTNGTIAAAAKYFAKLFTELDALKAKDKALEANISLLIPESKNDELDSLKAKVSTLTSDVATLKSEKAALASDVATLESKNAALAKKIEDLPSSGKFDLMDCELSLPEFSQF